MIFELSPPILYELGIEAAVEWLAEQIKEQHNIMVEFEDDNQSKPLDDDIRVLLFQAVRELLVNVVKHSQAHKAKVSVQKDGGNIRIHVEDNGIGFDSSKIYSYSDRTRGFGLFSIRERLDYLGGYFTIASEPGYGTRVTLGAPLKNNKESIKGKLHEHKDSLS
ncbi:MAG: ATP-binding protein [Nitrospirae bacterium]|nr:ATP-binding protein [Nitrospirota bacterium]